MNYKGYDAEIIYDNEINSFHGHVTNADVVINFEGASIKELEDELKNSVEDYLTWCKEDGVMPKKPLNREYVFKARKGKTGMKKDVKKGRKVVA